MLYIDVFFMVNFCLDLMILYATKLFIKSHHKFLRICLGALVGGAYSVLVMALPGMQNSVLLNLGNLCAAGVMSMISFPTKRMGQWIRQTIQLYIVTFIAGGIMNMLYYTTNFGAWLRELLYGANGKRVVLTVIQFVGITAITYVFLNQIRIFLMNWRRRQQNLYVVQIFWKEKAITCRALYDTGNSLREPFSGAAVHLVEYDAVKSLWKGDEKVEKSLYVIPYQSVGNEHGVLYGIRVERMMVGDVMIQNPLIAIYKGNLSAMGDYSMILNSETFEGCSNERKG